MYHDLDEIYRASNRGLAIFEHYFPHEIGRLTDPRHKFKIRDEKTASARIGLFKNVWRITDFGAQSEINGMSPTDWVMYREGLDFGNAVRYINEVILGRSDGAAFKKDQYKPEYSSRRFDPRTDEIGKYKFFFRDKASEKELKFIGRYVTREIMDKFDCKVVERYEYAAYKKESKEPVVHIFTAAPDYPIYLFDYMSRYGFQKLYRPMEREKSRRFLYVGQKPSNFIFGLDRLKETESEFVKTDDELADEPDERSSKDDEPDDEPEKESKIVKDLFRCAGESDAMNLASLGFHVYWLNSESADWDYDQFKTVDRYCEKHYQVPDLDKTGQAEAEKNALRHIDLYTVALPAWIAEKRDGRGNRCKDLKDFINLSGSDREQSKYDFTVLKSNALRARFWERSKKPNKEGKREYRLVMEYFYHFLKLHGFYKIYKSYERKSDHMFVKFDGKVFELIPPSKIKAVVKEFVKARIRSRKMMNVVPLLEKINLSNRITEAALFEGLEETEIDRKTAVENLEWLHFGDGRSIRITPDEIKVVRQSEVPTLILKDLQVGNNNVSHIIPYDDVRVLTPSPITVEATPRYGALLERRAKATGFREIADLSAEIDSFPEIDRYKVKINDPDFYFVKFLRNLSRIHWRKETEKGEELTETEMKEQDLALANLLFVYGYLCSEYKDPGKAWIVVTMDNKISDVGQSSGRSGKSLKTMGVRYVRPTFRRGGRDLDKDDNFKFIYDGYTEFHNNIEIDDFAEYGLFSKFYAEITGDRYVNPKNYGAFTLDYKHSGKMSLSTNFELQNTDPSTTARVLSEVASDWYHEKTDKNDYRETRKPDTEFGRRLYDDFTSEDRLKFYNIIAYSIQLQMRFYKINPPTGNIRMRELRREMQKGVGKTDDFFKWANTYFVPKPAGYNDEMSPAEAGYFGAYIVKDHAYRNLTEDFTQKQKSDYRPVKFKEHVKAWCDYYGFDFNPEVLHTDRKNKRIMKRVDGKYAECFYIHVKQNGEPRAESDNDIAEMPF